MTKHRLGRRRMHKNERGALEGLPLYLIILVVITAVALAVILAWLKPWQSTVDLQSIQSDVTSLRGAQKNTVTITAFDTKGNKMGGVTVTLEGAFSIPTQSKSTSGDGTATFSDIVPTVPASFSSGTITFRGEFSGTTQMVKTCVVNVIKVDLKEAKLEPSSLTKKTGAQSFSVTAMGTDNKPLDGAKIYLQGYSGVLTVTGLDSATVGPTGKMTFSVTTLKTGQFTVLVKFTGCTYTEKTYTVKVN